MKNKLYLSLAWILFTGFLFLSGCSTDVTILVNVTGLSANQSLTVQLIKARTSTTVLSSTTFTSNNTQSLRAKDVEVGDDFSIVISTPPTTDTCTVIDGNRTALFNFDPADVNIRCSATSFTLGGTLSGLESGESLVVLVNGSEKETLSSNGTFTLATHVSSGSPYTVTSFTEPGTKGCIVTDGSGTASANVSNISIVCQKANLLFVSDNFLGDFSTRAAALAQCQTAYTQHYTSYFTCSGGIAPFVSINDTEEIRDMPTLYTFRQDAPFYGVKQYYNNPNIKNHTKLADNWTDLLDGSLDEPFALYDTYLTYRTGSLPDGSISTHTCQNWTSHSSFEYGTLGSPHEAASGWMQSDYTWHCGNYIPILCLCMQNEENVADQYTVGGSVTGNTGSVVLSLNDGAQSVTIAAGDTHYIFSHALDDGASYEVSITSSPSGQTCTLENHEGTLAGDSVQNVNVTCISLNFVFPTTDTYPASLTSRATVDGYCRDTHTASYSSLTCASIHAFISFGEDDEIRDMPSLYATNTSRPIFNAVNHEKIADDWADLLDESPLYSNLTVDWWSGSLTTGASSTLDCSTWTSTSAMADVTVGWGEDSMDFIPEFWTGTSDGFCNQSHYIMCLCSQ